MKRLERGPRTERIQNNKAGAGSGGGQQSISLSDQKGQLDKNTKERKRADRKGEYKGRRSTLVDYNYINGIVSSFFRRI